MRSIEDKIIEFSDCAVAEHHGSRQSYVQFVAAQFMRDQGKPAPALTPDNMRGILAARIEHGRWLADCPTCGGALIVDSKIPLFICHECGSPENLGKWYMLAFPKNKAKIEAALLKRPGHRMKAPTRHWFPHETLKQLEAENARHGVK